ncbi:hypothetical protein SLEP1_g40845 [Rubroshorea leprosula]|uniref:DUF7792 domain-containing protein n=1 Tax=Rubroshorea leprosula TaxID=152421 RepID=A0AAV5L4R7_9ROSI|nr:hypothetical protein SLEP1_g40845 [Rubroshorea leprosula]
MIWSAASPPLYDRPIVRIVTEVSKNLERALTLVRKCKRCTLFRRFVTGKHATDFPRIFALLESSIADMNWLLSLFDPNIGCASREPDLSVPPIAIKDPVISWVWAFIATVEMSLLKNRIEAAHNLALLAQANEKNKRIIIKEGGVPPLLNLLKENWTEAQIVAANALYILSDDQERGSDPGGESGCEISGEVPPGAAGFRRGACGCSKTNSPDVRAVIDELLRVIKESEGPELRIPAIRSIGSLARIFPAREIRVIESLVAQIRSKHRKVAEEAVIALQKFVCEDHFLRSEHSKSIIKLNGVAALKRLIGRESPQAMVLLCYLYDSRPLQRYW